MRIEFFKILDRQYVEDFVSGYLFMNTLNYFRKIEGNAAQGDPLEGVCGSIRKDQLKQMGMYFDDELVKAIRGNVSLISDYYGLNNVFCLYQMLIDDENQLVKAPSPKLCNFNDTVFDDKVVVHVKNTERFLNQISWALEAGVKENQFEYGIYGSVIYSNSWLSADGPGTRSAFYKELSYSYQNEWRLCVLRKSLVDKAYKFFIGDLSDIVEVISLKEFIEHPEKLYPGHSIMLDDLNESLDSFRIFGTANSVNHLMFSYMSASHNLPVRSDQAQADWHYMKYLELTGRHMEIESYLDTRMKELKDFEHLELLAQYRLSIGKWVAATDAFMFFINEVPTVVGDDPGRFFFPLHTILMQNKVAADAGKLFKLATEKYNIPDDLKLSMQSDVLFALGFYDQVVSLYQKMKETSEDPLLDYYLGVSYLYLLDFEKAHQHLSLYEHYFSNSAQSANNVSHLRMLINTFRDKKQLRMDGNHQDLDQIMGWQEEWENLLSKNSCEDIFLGFDALYGFEKAQKWTLLDKFKTITICPLTIAEMINMYAVSGDTTFFDVIIYLSTLSELKITSPKLDYYLALDMAENELPSFVKMEKALHIQKMKNK